MKRFMGVGVLVGIATGIVIQFLFPSILKFEFLFNIFFRKKTGIPIYPNTSGSVFAVGVLFPIFAGIISGIIVAFTFRLIQRNSKNSKS